MSTWETNEAVQAATESLLRELKLATGYAWTSHHAVDDRIVFAPREGRFVITCTVGGRKGWWAGRKEGWLDTPKGCKRYKTFSSAHSATSGALNYGDLDGKDRGSPEYAPGPSYGYRRMFAVEKLPYPTPLEVLAQAAKKEDRDG